MDTRKSSRAIVLNKNNEIFLFRYKFDYLADESAIWITPGGSLEEGETFDDALRREVFEELGVELKQECQLEDGGLLRKSGDLRMNFLRLI
ncbi:MAG: NUDIX hydrolase [Lachnospiraceae bacterium]|nr:NUDIX hydrolase [Lachnospiraceae bacterium]